MFKGQQLLWLVPSHVFYSDDCSDDMDGSLSKCCFKHIHVAAVGHLSLHVRLK